MIAFMLMLAAQEIPSGERCRALVPAMTMGTLLSAEQRRSKAIRTRDKGALFDLYDDAFRGVTSDGVEVDKRTMLGIFDRLDPALEFKHEALSGMIGPGVVVSSGRIVARRKGRIVSRTAFLHVWRIEGCAWRIITGSSTPIAPGN